MSSPNYKIKRVGNKKKKDNRRTVPRKREYTMSKQSFNPQKKWQEKHTKADRPAARLKIRPSKKKRGTSQNQKDKTRREGQKDTRGWVGKINGLRGCAVSPKIILRATKKKLKGERRGGNREGN